ncbi:MAG: molybdenum cofactor guanylyltransferase [Acidimicrobiales bacterium]|nr:molybdenum cofactor guanylyltransferase [Acidimicrobiales bacterium]
MSGGFDGAVLCGGESRRMGTDKALVEIDGRPMAHRILDALRQSGASEVAAVGGDRAALSSLDLAFVADDHPGEGPLGATVTALRRVGTEPAVVVLACDLIAPSSPVVTALVERLAEGAADVVVPRLDGRPQWMHAAWRRRVAGVLEAVFDSGERSLFDAVHGIDVDFWDVADPVAFLDADCPEDLPSAR